MGGLRQMEGRIPGVIGRGKGERKFDPRPRGAYMQGMRWIGMTAGHSVAWGLATLSLAVTLGLALGAIRVRGMKLGVSGVLFAALALGQAGLTVDPNVLEFLRDFALILFVYALGLQVGPAFLSSLREEGLRLNVMSLAAVVLGALMTLAIVKVAGLPRVWASGLYAGAFTTTPGLAAGQEALRTSVADPAAALAKTGLAYTVTYPFGVIGPILVIVALRKMFGVRMEEERASLAAAEQLRRPPVETMDFEVTHEQHAGKALKSHPLLREHPIVLSRLLRQNIMQVPTGETEVQLGDIYRAVGPRPVLMELVEAFGKLTTLNVNDAAGDVRRMDLVVTRTRVLRRSLQELNLIRRTGVTIARIERSGVDLAPRASLRLQFGDRLTAVGPEAGLKAVESEIGNCPETLNRPQLVPIFLGIVLGVLVGSIPLKVPGLHTTLKIGLAGGPMIVAIVLSQFGNIGSVIWYMPVAANTLFRDFGLAVFLACVGLRSGDNFVQNLTHSGGFTLVAWGALITIVPALLVGWLARKMLRMNFITLAGWVAGAMTSSPALMFADDLAHSDAPAVPYAAVAPLALLTPILCSQLLVVVLS